MTATDNNEIDCQIERGILHTLLYFEIFSYPLRVEEIFQYSSISNISQPELKEKLASLVDQGQIFKYEDFYLSKDEPGWVPERKAFNLAADQTLAIAQRNAQRIGGFPFVRGVCVSGSLSKHCMRPDGDVDYFIITEPGRLWLARTLLVLYKKIFLLNSHKYFCVNYFIDTNHLEIEEQNLFTATEVITLLPMYGREYFQAFCAANGWAWEQYPNFPKRSADHILAHEAGTGKRFWEKFLGGSLGNWLDAKAMQLTIWFWKRKFKHLQEDAFGVALKSRRYVSKHHPLHFQEKVLRRFEELVKGLRSN